MSQYPAQIDTGLTLPAATDNSTPVSASIFNNSRSAIIQIETELGVKPSGISSTVRARLDALDTTISGLGAVKLAGDLGNTNSVPYVIGIQGKPVSSAIPNLGDYFAWNGIAWTPVTPLTTLTAAVSGDLTGLYPAPIVVGIRSKTLDPALASVGATQDGYTLTWVNADGYWEAKPAAIGFTAGGDLTGSATVQRVQQLKGVISLEQYGAVGDGITDDSAAFTAAIAALTGATGSGNHTIQLASNRTYLVGVGSVLPAGCSIIGYGDSSVLKTTGNGILLTTGGEYCSLSNFKMLGNNTGGAQQGLLSNYQYFKAVNLTVDSFYYAGIESISAAPDGSQHGNQFTNCMVRNCTSGWGWWLLCEYSVFTNCQALGNATGVRWQAGNLNWTGGIITQNSTNGMELVGGGNDGHGVICGVQINHNATNVYCWNVLALGQTLVDCMIYGTGTAINLISSVGVRFIGCQIDVDHYYFDGSTGTEFVDCIFPGSFTNTVHNNYNAHASTTYWNNCRALDGTVPAFIIAGYDGTNWQNSIDGYISLGASPTAAGLIKMEDLVTNSGTGATLTIHGQNETGTTSIGGDLILNAGTGTSSNGYITTTSNWKMGDIGGSPSATIGSAAGTQLLFRDDSEIRFRSGATTYGGIYMTSGNIYFGSYSSAASSPINTYFDCQTATYFRVLGGAYLKIDNAIGIVPAVANLQWTSSPAGGSPVISQADLTTVSGTGQTFTIQAQNETGTTSTGGNLALTSGTGSSADGYTYLKTGGTTRLTVKPTGVVTIANLGVGAVQSDASGNLTSSTLAVTNGGAAWKHLIITPFAGTTNTASGTYVVAGTFELNPLELADGYTTIKLRCIGETTSPQMSIKLYNLTTASDVTGSTLTTSSTTPVSLVTGDLSANLSAGNAMYQVQILMAAGAPADQVILDMANIRVDWV